MKTLPSKRALWADLLLVAARMMHFHYRLRCLEADGKMEFGVQDVLSVSAHVERRERSRDRLTKK